MINFFSSCLRHCWAVQSISSGRRGERDLRHFFAIDVGVAACPVDESLLVVVAAEQDCQSVPVGLVGVDASSERRR